MTFCPNILGKDRWALSAPQTLSRKILPHLTSSLRSNTPRLAPQSHVISRAIESWSVIRRDKTSGKRMNVDKKEEKALQQELSIILNK